MKTNQYIYRTTQGFIFASGLPMEEDSTLALVWSDETKIRYAIIDIASGLSILVADKKKNILERWETNKETLKKRIDIARSLPKYQQRIKELESWRKKSK